MQQMRIQHALPFVTMPSVGNLLDAGATVPADGTLGYAPGALFFHIDGSAGDLLYVNNGTKASSLFKPLPAAGGSVAVADADTAISAANSGRVHVVANVSADRTFTLPTPADGLVLEFVAGLNAADGHDWIFDTGSDTNYFMGGVQHHDTDSDAAGDELVLVAPDGNSNSILQVNLPQPGTRILFVCDGTLWTVCGQVYSAAAPTFGDQA
ncbi:MAG TPA: hypothetical protein VM529_24955 [Gemmata sp.]|jgi:hypothetical protein|nr:hypothetical protein [Gemmata sp.]